MNTVKKPSPPTHRSVVIGPAVRRADGITAEQEQKLRELGHRGEMPYLFESAARRITYLEREKASEEAARPSDAAIPNLIPGMAGCPNDRGECLALDPDTLKRCDGRRIASREYREGEGYLVTWTCNKCGNRRVL